MFKIRMKEYVPRKSIASLITFIPVPVTVLKAHIHRCRDCKHACYYPISFLDFRFTNPKCEISKVDIKANDVACENFELMGRRCR